MVLSDSRILCRQIRFRLDDIGRFFMNTLQTPSSLNWQLKEGLKKASRMMKNSNLMTKTGSYCGLTDIQAT